MECDSEFTCDLFTCFLHFHSLSPTTALHYKPSLPYSVGFLGIVIFGVCCSPTQIIASKRELFSEKNENFWRQKNLEFILIAFSSFCYGNFSHTEEKFKPQFLLLCTLLSSSFLFTYTLYRRKNLDDS